MPRSARLALALVLTSIVVALLLFARGAALDLESTRAASRALRPTATVVRFADTAPGANEVQETRRPVASESHDAIRLVADEPIVDEWPIFAAGSLGAALQETHGDRPWSQIRGYYADVKLDAPLADYGCLPWNEARTGAAKRALFVANRIESSLASRFLGAKTVETWVERLASGSEIDGATHSAAATFLTSASAEAESLIGSIASAVRREVERQALDHDLAHSPVLGWSSDHDGRGRVLFNVGFTIHGWTVHSRVFDYQVPEVAAEIAALDDLIARAKVVTAVH